MVLLILPVVASVWKGACMQTYEEQKAIVANLNVIDDVFFQKMAEDPEVAEEILRIILEKPELRVIESQVQRARMRAMCGSAWRYRKRMMMTIKSG